MQSKNEGINERNSDPEALYIKESSYGIIGWFKKSISNYANFDGRARRKEFWWFFTAFFILNLTAMFADFIISILTDNPSKWVYIVISLFLLIPMLSVTNRRLHDIGRSGWWQFLWIGPILAIILLTFFLAFFQFNYENGFMTTELAIVMTLSIFVGWIALHILMLFKTSPTTNKWGVPAKRV